MPVNKLELENLQQNLKKALLDLEKSRALGNGSLLRNSNNTKCQRLLKQELADINQLIEALPEDGKASADETE